MSLLSRSTGYLFLVVYVLSVVVGGNGIAAACCAVVQAILLVIAHRRPGPNRPVLFAQAAFSYLPIAFPAAGTVDLDWLLAATILVGPGHRLRWFGFCVVTLASGPAHYGLHADAATYLHAYVATTAVGLVTYGLLRLPVLLDRLSTTQDELSRVVRTEERLRVARDLRSGLGTQIMAVLDRLGQVRTEMGHAPELARRAADDVADRTRTIVAVMRRTAAAQHEFDAPSADPTPVARLAPRLALAALVAGLIAMIANQVLEIPERQLANGLGGVVLSVLLVAQVLRPRYAAALLGLQALFTLVPLLWLGSAWCSWLTLLAVAALLRERVSWMLIAVGSIALRAVFAEPVGELTQPGGWVFMALEATLSLYGLARFRQLSLQLNQARGELAARTAQLERLRLARDIHDLLGLTLSVLALKCDLIAELITRDPRRVATEVDQALRIAADAQIEAQALTDDRVALSVRHEVDSARTILAAAIATVSIDCDDDLPERVDIVLAPVVREAVTNVLRHSAATRVDIDCRNRNRFVRLRIHNDGVCAEMNSHGQGLRNMRDRVLDAGGSFAASVSDGEFRLEAAVPY